MKKLLSILLILAMILALAACAGNKTPTTGDDSGSDLIKVGIINNDPNESGYGTQDCSKKRTPDKKQGRFGHKPSADHYHCGLSRHVYCGGGLPRCGLPQAAGIFQHP